MSILNKEIAECVGLWFAEGDKKCKNEINFCNNSFELIEFFHKIVPPLFPEEKFNIRIYVYTPKKQHVNIPIENCKVNRYIDKQATKPYYIWRLASVKLHKKWLKIVKETINNKNQHINFLRGFFAGEGNIKIGDHYSRTIRIAQGKPLKLIEDILDQQKINYKFYPKERNYYITHKTNWDKCAKIKLADLHPIRKIKFWNAYNSYKQEHYRANYLKNEIFLSLTIPYSTKKLAKKFNRSHARIYDVLNIFKKQQKIINFRIHSRDYWIRKDQKMILISDVKNQYLNLLTKGQKTTQECAKKLKICHKSAFNRLKELEKLGLIKREKNKKWQKTKIKHKVIVI